VLSTGVFVGLAGYVDLGDENWTKIVVGYCFSQASFPSVSHASEKEKLKEIQSVYELVLSFLEI